ncbi:hypothetical protein B296_00053808, partial [Ensete ventricosum]
RRSTHRFPSTTLATIGACKLETSRSSSTSCRDAMPIRVGCSRLKMVVVLLLCDRRFCRLRQDAGGGRPTAFPSTTLAAIGACKLETSRSSSTSCRDAMPIWVGRSRLKMVVVLLLCDRRFCRLRQDAGGARPTASLPPPSMPSEPASLKSAGTAAPAAGTPCPYGRRSTHRFPSTTLAAIGACKLETSRSSSTSCRDAMPIRVGRSRLKMVEVLLLHIRGCVFCMAVKSDQRVYLGYRSRYAPSNCGFPTITVDNTIACVRFSAEKTINGGETMANSAAYCREILTA